MGLFRKEPDVTNYGIDPRTETEAAAPAGYTAGAEATPQQNHDEQPVAGRSPDYVDASGVIASVMTTPPEQVDVPLDAPSPVVDTGSHDLGAPGFGTPGDLGVDAAEHCPQCGAVIKNDHDLLDELLGWLAPAGGEFVHRFYVRLFEVAPYLRELFPAQIELQEEKLLSAIVSLLQLFQAGEAQMETLNSALARFGRSHTRFDPAATIEEYAVVKTVLVEIAGQMLGEKVTPRHTAALTRAYEYAAGMMLAAQATAKLSGVGRRRRTV